ncbi:MAG: alpha/beta hydrolase family protein [Blastocatellia bacterium]
MTPIQSQPPARPVRTMGANLNLLFLLLSLLGVWGERIQAQAIPAADRRMTELRHLDQHYEFTGSPGREGWERRAEQLRGQILASAGLLPMPEKTPIRATIFGRQDKGDYTVEKVYFESSPGFYVTGNLYRPKTVNGKAPAVLCPHGHWTYGRLENQTLNSGPARAASFARQGYVAFSYDMVGYNDSAAISHRFAIGHRENIVDRNALWSVNLLGLQLWNSIRSIDFLLTLPEVDPRRIACTGESGGGTQTFLLMAVDPRIAVASPVNMVSFYMQGGSLCENAPNLRIDTNNVEIASTMAPRPMVMISTSGDWTKQTLTEEHPAVRSIYRLFGAEDKLSVARMDAPHNYNQESRETVYGWFAHWMLGRAETTPIKERGSNVSPITDLLVFFGRPRPANELNEEQLADALIAAARKQLAEAQPRTAAGIPAYRDRFGATLANSILAEFPAPDDVLSSSPAAAAGGWEEMILSRKGRGDRVAVSLHQSTTARSDGPVALFMSSETSEPAVDEIARKLAASHRAVLRVAPFAGGRKIPGNINFFTTYNRTDEANRVQDLLTSLAWLKARHPNARVDLVGHGRAGLWALLARAFAPRIDRTIVDAAGFDSESDDAFSRSLPIPGLRRAGDFTTAVTIAPLAPLFIHNTGARFRADRIADIYRRLGRAEDFQSQAAEASTSEILRRTSSK